MRKDVWHVNREMGRPSGNSECVESEGGGRASLNEAEKRASILSRGSHYRRFGFAWLFLMAFDVNKVRTNFVPWLREFTMGYVVVFVIYIALVGYNMYLVGTGQIGNTEQYLALRANLIPMAPLFLLACVLMAYPMYLLIKIANFVRQSGLAIYGSAGVILLFFVYFISLPILQKRLNSLRTIPADTRSAIIISHSRCKRQKKN